MQIKSLVFVFVLASVSSIASAQFVIPAGASLDTSTFGGLDLGCTSLIVQGTVNIGSSTVSNATDVVLDGGSLAGNSGTVSLSGSFSNGGSFVPGTGTFAFTDACAAGPARIVGTTTFTNLSFVSSTGRTLVIPDGTSITVTGTLTLQGAPGAPVSIVTASGTPAIINLAPGATVIRSNVTLAPGVSIGPPVQFNATSIPTLSEYGVMLLSALLGLMAFVNRRRFTVKEKNALF